jgi:hypothetical protein
MNRRPHAQSRDVATGLAKGAGGAIAGAKIKASALAAEIKPAKREEGEAMKKRQAKRNPMAKALARPQYRPRIKPDKRRKIEAKDVKRQHSGDGSRR